jgi:hypothetical protein
MQEPQTCQFLNENVPSAADSVSYRLRKVDTAWERVVFRVSHDGSQGTLRADPAEHGAESSAPAGERSVGHPGSNDP